MASSGYSPAKDSQAASEALDALATTVGSAASSTATQVSAMQASTSALATMTAAAQAAAQALATVSTSAGGSGFGAFTGTSGGGGFGTGADFGNVDYGAFLADGTNRVPYDGFRATLHKDEAVVPAKFNPYAGGGSAGSGGGTKITVNNTAGDTTEASAKQMSDGSIEIMVRKLVRSEFHDDLRRSGSMSSGIKSKFGLQPVLPRRA